MAVLTFPHKVGNRWWYFREAAVFKRMAAEGTWLVDQLGFSLVVSDFRLTGRAIDYNRNLLVPKQG